MADSDEEVAIAIILAIYSEPDKRKLRKKRKRIQWVKNWLQKRDTHGFYSQLLGELRLEEGKIYKNYLRMTPQNS